MTIALVRQVTDALAEFSSRSRLYELTIGEGNSGPASGTLLVEAFAASDAVQEIGYRDVIVLSTSSRIDAAALLGQPAQLAISLADGSRSRFGGEISDVAMLGSDGGLARYRLRLSPWIWRLGQVRNSRVWQDRSVIEIVDAVFQAYQPLTLRIRCRWTRCRSAHCCPVCRHDPAERGAGRCHQCGRAGPLPRRPLGRSQRHGVIPGGPAPPARFAEHRAQLRLQGETGGRCQLAEPDRAGRGASCPRIL